MQKCPNAAMFGLKKVFPLLSFAFGFDIKKTAKTRQAIEIYKHNKRRRGLIIAISKYSTKCEKTTRLRRFQGKID